MERTRKTRLDIKLGICGEHGGDPFRVPIARLAAAQAALADKA